MRDARSWAFVVDSVPFTRAVIAGETSLGGSESACLGLARALAARGDSVHVFVAKLAEDASGVDPACVTFHPITDFAPMNAFIEWDVVVALRAFQLFGFTIRARMRMLWGQDLLVPGLMANGTMSVGWNVDHIAYVSGYHRWQWEDVQPELTPLGWVTRNGFDPQHVPTSATKDPHRIIHISRPERGLPPLLQMWPAIRAAHPRAELRLCRYASMYDGGEGSAVQAQCEAYDAAVAHVHAQVGGIVQLGQLHKRQLYQEIANAAVMWYPGVHDFAETSCVAAIEAQACSTPFVGSWKGALAETVPNGVLVKGDAESPEYQRESIAAVLQLLDGCAQRSFAYRHLQKRGRAHVEAYTYDAIAADWIAQVDAWFDERYVTQTRAVLRQLLHDDDHMAARIVAQDLMAAADGGKTEIEEAREALALCESAIAGREHTSDDYVTHALADPLAEGEQSVRFQTVVPMFANATRVLDVACGNGAFAIALALAHPTITVHGMDFAQGNIDRANAAAARVGVADRCSFECRTIYDFDRHTMHADWLAFAPPVPFDGLFVGEFIEHIAESAVLVDGLERWLAPGAQVVYTCPHGAFVELAPRNSLRKRSHVHRFHDDDLAAVFGAKHAFAGNYLTLGRSSRGNAMGFWIISYTMAPNRPAGTRRLRTRAIRTRPYQSLSVGLITKNAEADILRCLTSIGAIADEIVVGDTGSTDGTIALAEAFGARVLRLPAIETLPDGFSGARNAVLAACVGTWFLWIDADEVLVAPQELRRYLDTTMFNGFVLRQNHLYLDAPPAFDIPTRVFRRDPAITFYGCIHEQPQSGDANTAITPTLEPDDVQIAHTGYLTADIRERKRSSRNRPLLIRDQQRFPERLLGKVLLIREAVIQADIERCDSDALTPRAEDGYRKAIAVYRHYFDTPGNLFEKIARPWYEAALRHLGEGWEMEIAIAGRAGGLQGAQAKPERIWVRDFDEFNRLITQRVQAFAATMGPRPPFKTNPIVSSTVEAREEVPA